MGFAEDWAAANAGSNRKVGDTGYMGVGMSTPDGQPNASFGYLPWQVGGSFGTIGQVPQYNTPGHAGGQLFGGVGSGQPPAQAQPMKTAQAAPQNLYLQQPAQPAGQQAYSPGQYNPGWQPMVNAMTDNANRNLQNNLAQIGRAGVANGMYGNARQGVAEGQAIGDMNAQLGSNLAQLGFNQYNTDNNFDLATYNANQGWANQGFQNQLTGLDKMLGWNQTYGVGNATNVQNTPLNYWQQFSNGAAQMGGLGGSASQNNPGNPWLGALGGAQLGYQLFGGGNGG